MTPWLQDCCACSACTRYSVAAHADGYLHPRAAMTDVLVSRYKHLVALLQKAEAEQFQVMAGLVPAFFSPFPALMG